MRQNTGLCGNIVLLAGMVEHVEQGQAVGNTISRGVDTDHRIANTAEQPIKRGGRNTLEVICRVVGLQARGQAPLEPDRVTEFRNNANLARNSHHGPDYA